MGYRYGVRYRPMRHFPTRTTIGVISRSLNLVTGTLGLGARGVNIEFCISCVFGRFGEIFLSLAANSYQNVFSFQGSDLWWQA